MKKITLIVTVIFLAGINGYCQDSTPATLSVGGSAKVEHKPDLCKMVFEISVTAESKTEVRKIINERRMGINDLLKQFKFVDIGKIESAPPWLRDDRRKGKRSLEYTTAGRQRIEVPLVANEQQLNLIANSIYEKELDVTYKINYSFSQELKDSLDKVVLKLAIKNAKESAELIAEETGVRLIDMIKIDFNYRMVANRYAVFGGLGQRGDASSGQINVIKIPVKSVSEDIVITWEFKPWVSRKVPDKH